MGFPHPTDMSREGEKVSVTLEQIGGGSTLRAEGPCTVTVAAEMKTLLLQGLASGSEVYVDLEQVEEIDIAVLQLFWAVEHEAGRTGARVVVHASEAARTTAREAGFDRFPGEMTAGEMAEG
jgi:anti-anti-sigma regulatory factor